MAPAFFQTSVLGEQKQATGLETKLHGPAVNKEPALQHLKPLAGWGWGLYWRPAMCVYTLHLQAGRGVWGRESLLALVGSERIGKAVSISPTQSTLRGSL